MNRPASSRAVDGALVGLLTAITLWLGMWTWRGFVEIHGPAMRDLALLAGVVLLTGALARAVRRSAFGSVVAQLLSGLYVAAALVAHSPWLDPAHLRAVGVACRDAFSSASTYAPPVPGSVPPIDPILLGAGLICFVLADFFACGLRRPPLVGLPLLGVITVPVAVLGDGVPALGFALIAASFVAMLFVAELEAAARWGHALDSAETSRSLAASSGAIGRHAALIGVVATGAALLAPLVVPTLDLDPFDGAGSGAGGSGVRLNNPMTDLQRDLRRGADQDLLTVTTSGPPPSYLRLAVLTRFNGQRWTTGDRNIPRSQRADSALPAPVGGDADGPRSDQRYQIAASHSFSSTWLPTPADTASINAPGDWRYDADTRDFLAADSGLTTAGLDYELVAANLDLGRARLQDAGPATGLVPTSFLELPPDLPPIADELAREVTANASTDFERAAALQAWFRTHFTYDLASAPVGNGVDQLAAFLAPDGDHRGYCEQFASAMAVMARDLGIPARVVVGFLQPRRIGPDAYEFSSHDLHAWPELFFAGSGWVRFEPTPGIRTGRAPGYTRDAVTTGSPSQSAEPSVDAQPSATAQPAPSRGPKPEQDATSPDSSSHDSLGRRLLTGFAAIALLALAAVTPAGYRHRRRRRRLEGPSEEVWTELRDTAIDLGLAWPDRRSPRETARRLGSLSDALRESTALTAVVDRVERDRYALSAPPAQIGIDLAAPGAPSGTATLPELAAQVIEEMRESVPPRRARVASWWPRTVTNRRSGRDGGASAGRDVP